MLVDFLQIHGSRCGSALIGTSTVISLVISRKYLRNRYECGSWSAGWSEYYLPLLATPHARVKVSFLMPLIIRLILPGTKLLPSYELFPDWEDLVDSSTYHGRTWWFSFFATYPATETAAFAASASENRCVVRYSISLLHLANRPMSM